MSGQSAISSSNEDDDGLFYFESDHLALKGNRDYGEMLKTLVLLEVQRSKAIEDYEKLLGLQSEALRKPHSFYRKVLAQEDLGLPDVQIIAELPNIDWSKYPMELPNEVQQFINSTPAEQNVNTEPPVKHSLEKNKKTWSVEEQRRLEELLTVYPPEAIELHRYKKIAAALGNRTVKQVTSRVQKYFLKLYKAGLPIPGRIPKNAEKAKKSKLHMHQRFNHLLFKPSTFFPQLDIPVVMNEREVVPGPSTDVPNSSDSSYNNYLLATSSAMMKSSPLVKETKSNTDLQIELLQRVKLEKQKEEGGYGIIQHIGYKCNYCAEEPIHGTRWHCEECTDESIDFCSDCVVSQMYSATPHPLLHQLHAYSEETAMISESSSESTLKEDASDSNKDLSGSEDSSGNESTDKEDDSNFDEDNNTTNDFENVMVYHQKYDMEEHDPSV